ncbi:MAG: prolyl oligopeptidase family serine peptidase [Leptospiraceae bacterium]|nr:prolyl oligopeptidase family serine peptidase [Leptospiraceae bacterium]
MKSVEKLKSKKLLYSIFGVFGFLMLAGYVLSGMVLYPKINCNPNFHIYCKDPLERGLQFEEVSVLTSDGLELKSWYIPGDSSKKGILLVHGHGGMRNEGLRFSKVLHDSGYNLLLLSLRRNSGSFASMGYHEVKDVQAGVQYLKEVKQLDTIGILGFSMGAATSIMAMESNQEIKAGIFSSGFSSAISVLVESAWRDFSIPRYPLFPIAEFFINLRGNMKIGEVLPLEKIGRISPRPVFIMHCDRDDFVSSIHANILFERAKEPKEIWIPSCDKHEQIWNFYPDESEKKVKNFFEKNL